jgi:cytochrome c oxidase subunit 2
MLSASAESARESFALPIQASSLAEGVDETFAFVYWCSVVFFIALMGAMFYFVVAYKKKGDDDRTLDLKGHHTLEIVWSVFPSFLLIAMFVMGF